MKEVKIERFTVNGPSVRTNNALEFSESGKIAALWTQFYTSRPVLWTQPHTSRATRPQTVYGVYSDYESGASGDFTVTVGIKAEDTGGAGVSIEPGTYLAFPAEGEMPAAIIEAWKAVWERFSKHQPYERSYKTDFEQYDGPTSAVLYIGVKASG